MQYHASGCSIRPQSTHQESPAVRVVERLAVLLLLVLAARPAFQTVQMVVAEFLAAVQR